MSNYLGFDPLENSDYIFLSYNSEDAERITPLARELHRRGVPLWYDHGIEYGQKWEKIISGKIEKSKAVLLLFTKDILKKEDSYVKKEYRMAAEYFNKTVFVAMIDRIEKGSIPSWNVPWWMDVEARQYINLSVAKDVRDMADMICRALGKKYRDDYPAAPASEKLDQRKSEAPDQRKSEAPDQRKAEAPDQGKAETPVKTIENEKQKGEIGLREEKKSSDSKEHEIEQELNRLISTVFVANRSKREIEQYFNEKPAGNTVGRKLFTEAENQLENKNYKKAFELYCKCSTYLPGEFSYLCYCKAVCCSHLCSESYGPLVDLIYKGGIERNSGYFPHVENRMSAEGQEFLKWEQEGKKWNEKAMRLTPGLDARDGVKIIVMGGKDYFGCDHFHYLYK